MLSSLLLAPACPQVRREAVRCLGLYCFLEGIPTSPASHLLVLTQVLRTHGECSAVKAAAVQVRASLQPPVFADRHPCRCRCHLSTCNV
jgi:hypothetical protein